MKANENATAQAMRKRFRTSIPTLSELRNFDICLLISNFIYKNKPNLKTTKNDISHFLLKTKDWRLKTCKAKNKPNSNPISFGRVCRFSAHQGQIQTQPYSQSIGLLRNKNMQNEPKLKSPDIPIYHGETITYDSKSPFPNWVRFKKRTQLLVDITTPEPSKAEGALDGFTYVPLRHRTQFVGWAVPTRKLKQPIPMKSGFRNFDILSLIFNISIRLTYLTSPAKRDKITRKSNINTNEVICEFY